MRISYRMTSSAVLAVYVVGIIYSVLFPRHREPTMTAADGIVAFDPCVVLWEQMSPVKQLAALLGSGSFLVLLVKGLGNRPVQRWVTVVGLVSLGAMLWYNRWMFENCWTIFSFVTLGAIVLMYVHQLLPRGYMSN
jgi:hypothetical protein